jgi:hypothetical protein
LLDTPEVLFQLLDSLFRVERIKRIRRILHMELAENKLACGTPHPHTTGEGKRTKKVSADTRTKYSFALM